MTSATQAYGKNVSDLQTNVNVTGDAISGTIKYVTGYTGFNGSNPTEQEGNYLALDFNATPWPDRMTVELVGGTKGEVELTQEDKFCVFRITDKSSQTIRLKVDKQDTHIEKTYKLSGLTLDAKPPVVKVTVSPMTSSPQAYGKNITDLQENVTVKGKAISGTLKHVTGYTGFNGVEVEEQSGNYLALDFASDPWPDTVTVELLGGKKGPVSLTTDDKFCVFRITDKDSQKIQVKASKGVTSITDEYTLTGLVLQSE